MQYQTPSSWNIQPATGTSIDDEYTFGRPLNAYVGSERAHARLLILRSHIQDGVYALDRSDGSEFLTPADLSDIEF